MDTALYVVATPIGNLGDMTPRALDVLNNVDVIAAEDTRHSSRLMQHFGIRTRLLSCHEHNESQVSERIVGMLQQGQSIALISDAGTPLISDPGYVLVNAVREAGFNVVTIPGACAIVAALSVCGLATDRFTFAGFLPAKNKQRRERLEELAVMPHTWAVYESTHRIVASLNDMKSIFEADRKVVLAKELTKSFETVIQGTAAELIEWITEDEARQKGEFVLLVEGCASEDAASAVMEQDALLRALLEEMPVSKAAKVAAKLLGVKKGEVYNRALELAGDS
ncbi:16S rRNA (cytidine(1402)-2'-O)-methyltransferase [Spongorhabdus nitratireducens]